ncbi:MAG TPA: hypothetical protein VF782_00635 [Allosphingosinicella sp.]|jgi:hypothetical protein
MIRRLAPLLLALPLASCQPPDLAVRAAFFGNALVFVAADPGDSDSTGCWREGTVVDDSLQPVWRFSGPGTGQCRTLLPLYYGRAPEGARTAIPAGRLEPGRLYLFIGHATAEVHGAFAFTRAGECPDRHNIDSRSRAADSLRARWWQRKPGIDDSPPPAAEAGR